MYAATDTSALPHRGFLQRYLVGSWSYRHPSLSMVVRMISGTWNLALGMIMLSYGYWLGLVPLAGSALLFWAVYLVAQEQSGSRRNGQS